MSGMTGACGNSMTEMKKRPFFVVIEGIDGTGKSTLARAVQKSLAHAGVDCLCTFEPTDGPWGKKLRESFSGRKRLSLEEELELFLKDRREHVEKEILPALRSGKAVVCDRYYLSTMAYQGARGMDMEKIRRRNEVFPTPDIAFLLELPVEEAVKRITGSRGEALNNFEKEEYLRKVAENFNSMHEDFIVRLDASYPEDELLEKAMGHIKPLL